MYPKQENYQLARQLAIEALVKSNLEERAAQAGGDYEPGPDGQSTIGLMYLGHELFLCFPEGKIEDKNKQGVPLREEIFILHYLQKATGVPLTQRWASFTEIPGGAFYSPVFLQRCRSPLAKFFGSDPELLKSAVEGMKGESLHLGDVGFKIRAFPFVPLALVLWRGDEEFPAEANLLFDASIPEYLPVEDIVVLAETVVWKLIKKGERLKAKGPR